MSLIEGIGDEVLTVYFIVSAIMGVLLRILYLETREVLRRRSAENTDYDTPTEPPPPIHNPNTCPICWNTQSLALETNCGHLYCGRCLLALYNQEPRMKCPMCRQQLTLLFNCFNAEERAAPPGSEVAQSRQEVLMFVRTYNRMNSNEPVSLIERIFELPVFLRHYYNEVIQGNFGARYLHFRLYALIILSVLYLLIPMDLLPEHVFGLVGLVDDVILIIIFGLYLAQSYRVYLTESGSDSM